MLDGWGIEELRAHGEEIALAPGEVLFGEGDEADALYVVIEGAVQVVGTAHDGRELVLRRLEPGAVFGEQAVRPGPPGRRTAGVRGAEPTRLLRLSRDAFHALVTDDDPARRRLDEAARANLREQLQRRSRLVGTLGFDPQAREATLAAGTVLFREGDEADRVYLILAGAAAAYRGSELLRRVGAGRCVGELAFVRRAARSATVIAETELHVLELDGARFLERLATSPELAEQMRALDRVYQLPARGVVTQHSGVVLGQEAVTTLYHLDDGRQFAASRIVATDHFHLERVVPGAGDVPETLRFGDAELGLLGDGTIVRVVAGGGFAALPDALLLAIDGVALEPEQRARFTRDGLLPAAESDLRRVLCTCVQVTRDAVDAAIAGGCTTPQELQRELSCGAVCGACVPRLRARLGEAEWSAAEVTEERELTPEIRAFTLQVAGAVRGRPGQHVVVRALIDGRWVERPYTLTGPPGTCEITVRRESQGLFSRWMFDVRDGPLRVSRPRGETLWRGPMLCLVAGVGVAPAVAAARAGEPMHVHYSARGDFAHLEALAGADVIARDTAREGRLTAADVHALVGRHAGVPVYVCGPPAYLLDVVAHLRAAGVAPERIHTEVFTHAGAPVEAADRPKWMPRPRRPASRP